MNQFDTFKMALLMVMLALVPGEMFDPMPQGEGIDEGNIVDASSVPCRGCGVKGTSAGGCWDCCQDDDRDPIDPDMLCMFCGEEATAVVTYTDGDGNIRKMLKGCYCD